MTPTGVRRLVAPVLTSVENTAVELWRGMPMGSLVETYTTLLPAKDGLS